MDTRTFCAPPRIDAPGASPDQQASIAEAVGLWSAVGIDFTGPDAVTLAFVPGPPADYGYYDAGAISINDGLSTDAAAIAIAHELGHAVGLVHVTGRSSVMNPGNLDVAPTAADRVAISPCE